MQLFEKISKENIVEYLLLMFQLEDVVRALHFDKNKVFQLFSGNNEKMEEKEAMAFYTKLIEDMQSEGIIRKGHLSALQDIILELVYLHNTLITIFNNEAYKKIVADSSLDIAEFRKKSNLKEKHDVEVMLHAMYMQLQLNMRKQKIGEETLNALNTMRKQLAFLAEEYKKMKSGDLNFIQN